jgi:hypothetical protein
MSHLLKSNSLIPLSFILLSVFIPGFREIKLVFALIALILASYQIIYFLKFRNSNSVFEILANLSLNFLIVLYSIFMIILALFWR